MQYEENRNSNIVRINSIDSEGRGRPSSTVHNFPTCCNSSLLQPGNKLDIVGVVYSAEWQTLRCSSDCCIALAYTQCTSPGEQLHSSMSIALLMFLYVYMMVRRTIRLSGVTEKLLLILLHMSIFQHRQLQLLIWGHIAPTNEGELFDPTIMSKAKNFQNNASMTS